jgi:multidrug efflux pump
MAEIAEIRLRAGDATIRLGDIAEVARGYVDPPVFRMRFQNRDAIGLGVVMARDGNVVELGPRLDTVIAAVAAEMPLGIEIGKVADQPRIVGRYIGEFLTTLLEAIAIVLVVSFVSLGLRVGLVVALTIPLVLAITFLAMDYLGIALQKISLGALIIALGLLVDDAMIAVEMMARKLEEGMDKAAAATYAFTSTAMPMLTGTLITVAGFLPVGLAKSTAGEYTFSIFAVVGIALVVSWFAAVFFTPYLGYVLLAERKAQGAHAPFETRFYRALRAFVDACLRRRWLVIGTTGVLFAAGFAGLGIVPKQFFPASNRAEAMVELWLSEGSAFAATEAAARQMERALAGDPDIVSVTSYVGGGSPRFYLPLDQQLQASNFAQLVVLAADLEARERAIARIRAEIGANAAGVRGSTAAHRSAGPCSSAYAATIRPRCANSPTPSKTRCAPIPRRSTCTTIGTRRRRVCASRSTRTARAPSASPRKPYGVRSQALRAASPSAAIAKTMR